MPFQVNSDEVQQRVASNANMQYGSTVEEVVRGLYNEKFEMATHFEKKATEKLKAANEKGKQLGEPGGKSPSPTPPKPVDYSTVKTSDIFATAETALLEAMKKAR